jgi:hypothetical protein
VERIRVARHDIGVVGEQADWQPIDLDMSADQSTTLLPLGGMNPSGDPDMMPAGATRLMENVVFRPGRTEKRPALIWDGEGDVAGLANWLDTSTGAERLVVALNPESATIDLKLKSATTEAYGAPITGPSGGIVGYMSDYCNYRGLLYYAITNGTASGARALGLHSFDGATIVEHPLGGETLAALVVKPYGDRLFLWNVWATIKNELGTTDAYDGTGWTLVNATATNITSGSAVICRVIPTSTTTAKLFKKDKYTVAASATPTTLIFRSDLQNTSPTYAIPMTLDVYYSQAWTVATVYALGTIRVPSVSGGNGLRYRVTTAGTSHATTEPTWPTTVGTTVNDNGVVWTCDGLDTIGTALTSTLPTISEATQFLPYFVRAVIPANPVSAKIGVRIKFGTPAQPTITLAAVDISFKDGLTDGDLRKKNHGQQLTVGKFTYPFFNQQSSDTVTIALDNDGYHTEVSDPTTILGNYYNRLSDLPGKVTAAAIVGGRQVVFKRHGMWVFQLGTDPNDPLVRERFFSEYGCVGPRALLVFEDTLYFVGESEVYRWKPGGEPEPIGTDAMREELMNRGGWIETTTNDSSLMGIISVGIDEANRDLLVATQRNYAHCMDIDGKGWSRIVAHYGAGLTKQMTFPVWNRATRHAYLVMAGGLLIRYDDSATVDSLGSTYTGAYCQETIIVRPMPREETAIDGVWIHHMTSVTQAATDDGDPASTLTVYASLDSGATWNIAPSTTITVPQIAAAGAKLKTKVPLRTNAPGAMLKFVHTGRAGTGTFTLTGIEPITRPLAQGERNRSNA